MSSDGKLDNFVSSSSDECEYETALIPPQKMPLVKQIRIWMRLVSINIMNLYPCLHISVMANALQQKRGQRR